MHAHTATQSKVDSLLWQKVPFIVFQAADLCWVWIHPTISMGKLEAWAKWLVSDRSWKRTRTHHTVRKETHSKELEIVLLNNKDEKWNSMLLLQSDVMEVRVIAKPSVYWRQEIEDVKPWENHSRGTEGKFPVWCFNTLIDKVNADMFT